MGAWWVRVLERYDNGMPTGKYRLTVRQDEIHSAQSLCDCEHVNCEDANECPIAREKLNLYR